MHFASLFALALPAIIYAQNVTVVQVGGSPSTQGGMFQFIPPTVNASKGDVIMFKFTGAPGNHSVTQSTLSDPCNPMAGGFDSGWVLIPQNGVSDSETPVWNLTVTDDSQPLWFFCKQLLPSPHCIAGMVGAVNAPTSGDNTFETFQNNAHMFKGSSGQGVGALVGDGASASANPAPLTDGAALFGTPLPSATSPASGGSTAVSSTGSSASASNTSGSNAAITNQASFWLNAGAALLGVALV